MQQIFLDAKLLFTLLQSSFYFLSLAFSFLAFLQHGRIHIRTNTRFDFARKFHFHFMREHMFSCFLVLDAFCALSRFIHYATVAHLLSPLHAAHRLPLLSRGAAFNVSFYHDIIFTAFMCYFRHLLKTFL